MNVTKAMIKTVQHGLNTLYHHSLIVDGDAGPKTMNALAPVNAIPSHWKKDRKLIGFIQHYCDKMELNAGPVDGYWGPQTDYGYDQLQEKIKTGAVKPWRDDEGIGGSTSTSGYPLQTQSELEKYYGKVGTNQTSVVVPYTLKLAWDTDTIITKFSCHESLADSIFKVLDRALDHYGDRIPGLGLDLWGGCLNVRKMRGGSKWSTHSWGCAIDWDPARNRLRWKKNKANFAKPEYDMWWKLWEDEGWTSLGRAKNYDWMHIQGARVK